MLYEGHWFQFKGEARSNFLIVDKNTFCKVVFPKFWFSLREHINVVSLSSKLLNFKEMRWFLILMVRFTMSGKREKSHKGVKHKTKTKSYGRNGEKKQSNKVIGKE